MNYDRSEFSYEYPDYLIAHTPIEPRDSARLLISSPPNKISDNYFFELPLALRAGDIVVRNISRVIPARLILLRASGGERELLLAHPTNRKPLTDIPWPHQWRVMIRGEVREGEILMHQGQSVGKVTTLHLDGTRTFEFNTSINVATFIHSFGAPPLPPYIHTNALAMAERYQTTYAQKSGSVAAPTAGLHFTDRTWEDLSLRGVKVCDITLHVGLGTFKPLGEGDVRNQHLHAEWAEITPQACELINATREAKGRIIAVGTTSARTLEHFGKSGTLRTGAEEIDLYITTSHTWQMVNGLITNFHLPESSLLVLVESFIGSTRRQQVYAHAIREQYRLFSFGDSSLLWR